MMYLHGYLPAMQCTGSVVVALLLYFLLVSIPLIILRLMLGDYKLTAASLILLLFGLDLLVSNDYQAYPDAGAASHHS